MGLIQQSQHHWLHYLSSRSVSSLLTPRSHVIVLGLTCDTVAKWKPLSGWRCFSERETKLDFAIHGGQVLKQLRGLQTHVLWHMRPVYVSLLSDLHGWMLGFNAGLRWGLWTSGIVGELPILSQSAGLSNQRWPKKLQMTHCGIMLAREASFSRFAIVNMVLQAEI